MKKEWSKRFVFLCFCIIFGVVIWVALSFNREPVQAPTLDIPDGILTEQALNGADALFDTCKGLTGKKLLFCEEKIEIDNNFEAME